MTKGRASGKGGARHPPKPFIDSGVLFSKLSLHKELVQNFGRYDTVFKNLATDAARLMQVLPLIRSLVELESACEIHTQPLRQALSKMVMDDPSVNNSKFQRAVWCNLRQERLTCVMAHFRRLKNDAETAWEYLQLRDVVDKIKEKEAGLPVKRLKKEISDVSMDSQGYPKDLETPEKETLPKGGKSSSSTQAIGDVLSNSTLTKGMVSKRKRLLKKRMGSRVLPMSSSLDAGLEQAFWLQRGKQEEQEDQSLGKRQGQSLAKRKLKQWQQTTLVETQDHTVFETTKGIHHWEQRSGRRQGDSVEG